MIARVKDRQRWHQIDIVSMLPGMKLCQLMLLQLQAVLRMVAFWQTRNALFWRHINEEFERFYIN